MPSGGGCPPQQQLPPHPPQQDLLCPLVAPPTPVPPPTIAAKVRVRARGGGKQGTMAPAALATIAGAPRCGPPSTIPGSAPSRCGQGCILHSSCRRIYHSMPYLLHRCTTTLPVTLPLHPCRRLHHTTNRLRPLHGHPGWARGMNSHWPTPSTPWP
jgi:hypothetical protein